MFVRLAHNIELCQILVIFINITGYPQSQTKISIYVLNNHPINPNYQLTDNINSVQSILGPIVLQTLGPWYSKWRSWPWFRGLKYLLEGPQRKKETAGICSGVENGKILNIKLNYLKQLQDVTQYHNFNSTLNHIKIDHMGTISATGWSPWWLMHMEVGITKQKKTLKTLGLR